jgi:uncharacterized membrane protein (DUF485 family)
MDVDAATRRHARRGLILFTVYLLLYGGFVAIPVFAPAVMATRPFGGVELSVWYGMALIVAPLALAAIYLWSLRGDAS